MINRLPVIACGLVLSELRTWITQSISQLVRFTTCNFSYAVNTFYATTHSAVRSTQVSVSLFTVGRIECEPYLPFTVYQMSIRSYHRGSICLSSSGLVWQSVITSTTVPRRCYHGIGADETFHSTVMWRAMCVEVEDWIWPSMTIAAPKHSRCMVTVGLIAKNPGESQSAAGCRIDLRTMIVLQKMYAVRPTAYCGRW